MPRPQYLFFVFLYKLFFSEFPLVFCLKRGRRHRTVSALTGAALAVVVCHLLSHPPSVTRSVTNRADTVVMEPQVGSDTSSSSPFSGVGTHSRVSLQYSHPHRQTRLLIESLPFRSARPSTRHNEQKFVGASSALELLRIPETQQQSHCRPHSHPVSSRFVRIPTSSDCHSGRFPLLPLRRLSPPLIYFPITKQIYWNGLYPSNEVDPRTPVNVPSLRRKDPLLPKRSREKRRRSNYDAYVYFRLDPHVAKQNRRRRIQKRRKAIRRKRLSLPISIGSAPGR